jgi:hypothetical protein
LKNAKVISIPRCYFQETRTGLIELHAFSDASESSYGACVYILYEHEAGVKCNLVASKTRVAPMSEQSIPRLELLGCLISARLVDNIRKALQDFLKIHAIFFWSDSTVALNWIGSVCKEYKQFVENRVQEIRRLTDPNDWRYCPTKDNPADIASSGKSVSNDKWWYGPTFLLNLKDSWPVQPSQGEESKNKLQELKTSKQTLMAAVVDTDVQPELSIEKLLKRSKYSKLETLLRVTAYVQRFVDNVKRSLKGE